MASSAAGFCSCRASSGGASPRHFKTGQSICKGVTYNRRSARRRRRVQIMEKASVLVLIAENQVSIQSILQDAFEEGGFAVLAASNADQAIEVLNARHSEVRALVTDIQLGSAISGWDVARHARENNPTLPVVYTTGSNAADWPSMGVPNSIVIPKPFVPAQVLVAVSQLLNTGSPLPPAAT